MDPTSRVLFFGSGGVPITGDSASNPATSGIEIRDQGQSTGWYWIQTSSMSSAKLVYVNNTDDGGGWMCVSYECRAQNDNIAVPVPRSFSLTGSNPPSGWANTRFSANAYELWYHNGSAQCDRTMRMASTSLDQQPILSSNQIARRVVYANPGDFQQMNTSSLNTGTKLSGTWTPLKGFTSMSSSLTIDAPCDWLYNTGTFYWTDCGPSDDLTTDGRSGNGHGTGSYTYSGGPTIYGLANVAATVGSSRTDLNTFAQYIR